MADLCGGGSIHRPFGLLLSKLDQAEKAGIGMVIARDSMLPGLPPLAAGAIITILGNLIQNAHESLASAAKPDGRIEVSLKEEIDRVDLRVHDNGAGFPAELRERISRRDLPQADSQTWAWASGSYDPPQSASTDL